MPSRFFRPYLVRFAIRRGFLPLAILFLASGVCSQERRVLESILPDARAEAVEWRYATEAPGEGWQEPGFDDQAWSTGLGGFGAGEVANARINTAWTTGEIWLRRAFDVPAGRFEELVLSLHHDDDAEVYVNGVQVSLEPGFSTAYGETFLSSDVVAALKPEGNVIAVHCANAGSGPQYVDAGLSGARTVTVAALSPDARILAQTWKYSLSDPGADWQAPGFSDASWSEGIGGFGSGDPYAALVGTNWTDADIWLRRTFTADKEYPEYQLTFQHDDGLEVYINGMPVHQAGGWIPDYKELLLTAGQAGVKAGENVLAVHCSNAGTGAQFVDVGLLGLQGPIPSRAGPDGGRKGGKGGKGGSGGRVARSAARPLWIAAGGRLDLASLPGARQTPGRGGRVEIFALDGSRSLVLVHGSEARTVALPASLGPGAYRFRWTSVGSRAEGTLIRLP